MSTESSSESEIETKLDAPVEPVTDEKVTSEDSSTSGKGEKGDMLSAVKAALEPKEKSPASDEPGTKTEAKLEADAPKDGDAEGDGSAALSEEETSRLKSKTRKRIEFLTHEVTARDSKIAEVTPKADKFDQIQRFVDEAGLSKDDVNGGFDIMRNLKTNPLRAYEQLRPLMDQLESVVGITLPADLQQAVQRGELTEAHARELSRSRSSANIMTHRLTETERRTQVDTERRQFQGHVDDAANAATEWEKTKAKTDPDWKHKGPRVQELVELMIVRKQQTDPNYFPSKDDAVKMANDALKRVEDDLKRLAPHRRATANPPNDAGSTTSVAKPKTMLEAARLALQKTG